MANTPFDIDKLYVDGESFRDSIATVDKDGKRIWVYPKKPNGPLYSYRKLLSYALMALLFFTPLIKINGDPLFLFNVIERKFILFGSVFYPQDFHLFLFTMLTFVVFIILFTVVYGRLFCGWVCPQTIFMEMLFRRIEYAIEGDANSQIRLNKSEWNTEKILKKALKHFIFFSISFFIANVFLSYIIGFDEVKKIILEPVSQHLYGFIAIVIFSYAFYGVFAFMREQVCTTICPYGRLQGVLLDKNSIVISYDNKRGEPRGKLKKESHAMIALPVLGDCIDCNLCVRVCPTGIDIRNGTQLECTNCTACIDACDEVMIKIQKPQGLIRFDSANGIENGMQTIWTNKVKAYSAVLSLLILFNFFLLGTRNDVESIILRTPGMLYQDNNDGFITNLYNFKLINKTAKNQTVKVFTDSQNSTLQFVGHTPPFHIEKGARLEGSFFIKIKKEDVKKRISSLAITVKSNNESVVKKTKFIGPF
jgi:cytochrome c oxidase accessory protein FixG